MKKLIVLIAIFSLGCSSGDGSSDEIIEEKIPKEIKLTLEKVWLSKTLFHKDNTNRGRCNGNNQYYMYANGWSGSLPHHYGLDTLHIDLKYGNQSISGFDFNIKNPSTSESKTHPRYINYIKVENHVGKKILINSDWLEPEWSKKITYWSSNLSEEELKSLLIKTVGNGCPSDSDAQASFQKSSSSISSIKNTTKNIPYNQTNDDETKVGEQWQNYIILAKEYIY